VAALGDGDPGRRALRAAAGRALGWLALQEEGVAALERRLGLAAMRLPRLDAEPFGRPEIERLAGLAYEACR
jgi:hypothetical protein